MDENRLFEALFGNPSPEKELKRAAKRAAKYVPEEDLIRLKNFANNFSDFFIFEPDEFFGEHKIDFKDIVKEIGLSKVPTVRRDQWLEAIDVVKSNIEALKQIKYDLPLLRDFAKYAGWDTSSPQFKRLAYLLAVYRKVYPESKYKVLLDQIASTKIRIEHGFLEPSEREGQSQKIKTEKLTLPDNIPPELADLIEDSWNNISSAIKTNQSPIVIYDEIKQAYIDLVSQMQTVLSNLQTRNKDLDYQLNHVLEKLEEFLGMKQSYFSGSGSTAEARAIGFIRGFKYYLANDLESLSKMPTSHEKFKKQVANARKLASEEEEKKRQHSTEKNELIANLQSLLNSLNTGDKEGSKTVTSDEVSGFKDQLKKAAFQKKKEIKSNPKSEDKLFDLEEIEKELEAKKESPSKTEGEEEFKNAQKEREELEITAGNLDNPGLSEKDKEKIENMSMSEEKPEEESIFIEPEPEEDEIEEESIFEPESEKTDNSSRITEKSGDDLENSIMDIDEEVFPEYIKTTNLIDIIGSPDDGANKYKWTKFNQIKSSFFTNLENGLSNLTENNWKSKIHELHKKIWDNAWNVEEQKKFNPSEVFNMVEIVVDVLDTPEAKNILGISEDKDFKINREWFMNKIISPILRGDKQYFPSLGAPKGVDFSK